MAIVQYHTKCSSFESTRRVIAHSCHGIPTAIDELLYYDSRRGRSASHLETMRTSALGGIGSEYNLLLFGGDDVGGG